jgi:transposase InsO family protein
MPVLYWQRAYDSPTVGNRVLLQTIVSLGFGGCLLLAATASPASRLRAALCAPWLTRIGLYSYSLYVIHAPIIVWAGRKQITPHSPWQNGTAERWVETVRRDLLDHVIVLNERHLQRLLSEFVAYYHDDRTHLALGKGTPSMRTTTSKPNRDAEIVGHPRIGGLHHRYGWRQAA